MGKEALGIIIRQIDYLRAKGRYEYEFESNPYELLDKFKFDSLDFNFLKDAWQAFEERVCVPGYPETTSPACLIARQTVEMLVKLTKSLLESENEVRSFLSELLFNMLLSCIKAGPGSTHCHVMDEINCKTLRPLLEEHVQTFDKQTLVAVMQVTKVTFGYTPNDYCTDEKLGLRQRESLLNFFLLFTSEQVKEVQLEFLDVYKYYHLQLPAIAQFDEYSKKMAYLFDEIGQKFEHKNPYMNLQSPEILRQHFLIVKDLVCSDHFSTAESLSYASRKLLLRILKSRELKDAAKDLFDPALGILLEMTNNPKSLQNAGLVLYTLQDCLFGKIDGSKIKVTFGNVEDVVRILKKFLLSGQNRAVDVTRNLLTLLKKSKAIDWKNHVDDARQMIEIVGDISRNTLQDDKDSNLGSTFTEYKNFMEDLLQQLQRSKVTSQLKKTLVQFFFSCILSDPELKAELGRDSITKEILDLSNERELRLQILREVEKMVQNEDHPWDNMYFERAVKGILLLVVESYPGGGSVSKEENSILMSIFKHVSEGCDSVLEQFYDEDNPGTPNWKLDIFLIAINNYMRIHMDSRTFDCLVPLMHNVLRWARIAHEENHKDMIRYTLGTMFFLSQAPPEQFGYLLPDVMDLMMATKQTTELFSFVSVMYPQNPKPVNDRIDDIFKIFEKCKEDAQRHFAYLLNTVAQHHPEVFDKSHIGKMFERYKNGFEHEKYLVLMSLKAIAEKFPKRLAEFFSQLLDDSMYKEDMSSVHLRCSIIACVGTVNQKLGQHAVDHLMKYVDHSDVTVAQVAVRELDAMAKPHQAYMQKYKQKLQKVEKTSTVPQLKDAVHEIILILEGKSVENIAEDVQQQQEDIEAIDDKVDMTIDTVIGIGDKVIEHDKEIGELETGLEKVEERVDDVEEDLGETKIKVEEIDNKTMTNAPKWSRDLTKLMNPEADNDWRLLASRLGYTNDDIRSWATQHDPCMALLSEWYATHKTSEASYGVLNALTEMNRVDGAAIVENAMKLADGVVEDEEFEYASPPPVFISYQWGFQNEVKLLKHHLNMAGYECWMDVGQMGGGDKLFAMIDNGIRGAKVVICCTTEKYAQSPNCNREVNLSVNLNKPIIPLLMEKMNWPPKGSMGPIFSEYLFIRFFQRGGEETPEKDQRYWPIPKFQELLMQLIFYVVPDQKMVHKEYARWWASMVEDIVIDKTKGKKKENSNKPSQKSEVVKSKESPLVFLSYQWGKQPQVKALYQRLTSHGYTVWMDIYQMGGGDSLYDKIDRGMRGCKAVVSCVTHKYSLSANCRREVSLADALKKPIIPLLLEDIKWPPDGPMSMVFTQLLYINFHRDEAIQMTWEGDQFEELRMKLGEFVPETGTSTDTGAIISKNKSPGKSHDLKKDQGIDNGAVVSKDVRSGKLQAPKKAQGPDNGAVVSKDTSPRKSQAPKEDQRTNNDPVVLKDVRSAKSQAPKKDQKTTQRVISQEKSTNLTTIQGSAGSVAEKQIRDPSSNSKTSNITPTVSVEGSAAGKQKRGSASGGKNLDKTPTIQKTSEKKAVAVRAFGGSIVKDKVAQDIAAGTRSTKQRSGSTESNGKVTNSASRTKDETTNVDPTFVSDNKSSSSVSGNRNTFSVSGKGTQSDKSTSKVSLENSKTEASIGNGTNEIENRASTPTQTNNAIEVKQNKTSSKQVNGDSNEPKSKSCVII